MCNRRKCIPTECCCGCCSLRTSCLVYGWLQILFSVLWNIGVWSTYAIHKWYDPVGTAYSISSLLIGSIIIIGTYEKKTKLLWAAFFTEIIWIFCCLIPVFYFTISHILWSHHPFGIGAEVHNLFHLKMTGFVEVASAIFSACFVRVLRGYISEAEAERGESIGLVHLK